MDSTRCACWLILEIENDAVQIAKCLPRSRKFQLQLMSAHLIFIYIGVIMLVHGFVDSFHELNISFNHFELSLFVEIFRFRARVVYFLSQLRTHLLAHIICLLLRLRTLCSTFLVEAFYRLRTRCLSWLNEVFRWLRVVYSLLWMRTCCLPPLVVVCRRLAHIICLH
ncbi:hypothetical protein ANCCEY_09118 [Ancylostoma ceylanicum]|uniref:Uncharacterized protein n=1 Tax=Ancylostoma ceylanicum TaxID=53326 RepID=A0A0D6LKZ2_9BILA|nr:hypothetical protein ANCCEY_09118 [Ancylostoma ceylanicum]